MVVLELTSVSNRPVYINPTFITTFLATDKGGTIFFFSGGDTQEVTNSINNVLELMHRALKQ